MPTNPCKAALTIHCTSLTILWEIAFSEILVGIKLRPPVIATSSLLMPFPFVFKIHPLVWLILKGLHWTVFLGFVLLLNGTGDSTLHLLAGRMAAEPYLSLLKSMMSMQ